MTKMTINGIMKKEYNWSKVMDIELLLVGFTAFLQTGLKAFNTLNIVKRRYLLAFFMSMGISIAWVYGAIHVVGDPMKFAPIFVICCASGVTFSMWAETKLFKEK